MQANNVLIQGQNLGVARFSNRRMTTILKRAMEHLGVLEDLCRQDEKLRKHRPHVAFNLYQITVIVAKGYQEYSQMLATPWILMLWCPHHLATSSSHPRRWPSWPTMLTSTENSWPSSKKKEYERRWNWHRMQAWWSKGLKHWPMSVKTLKGSFWRPQ